MDPDPLEASHGRRNRDAAATDDRRKALVALRDTLATELDTTTSAVHSQLSSQYTDVLRQIDEIDRNAPVEEETPLDELQKRRAARHGDATDRPRAARDRKRRNS